MRVMASDGKSASEIAAALGSTPGSVRVKCCQLKIGLTRRGRPSLLRSEPANFPDQKVVVCLPAAVYADLSWHAAQKDISAAKLSQMLLEAIVGSDLYKAVLDESER
jgi:hypothetical protein